MSLRRFLNLLYSVLIENLDYKDAKEYDKAKRKLDRDLEVNTWKFPVNTEFSTTTKRNTAVDAQGLRPPNWWESDEEASQSFLRTMGVRT